MVHSLKDFLLVKKYYTIDKVIVDISNLFIAMLFQSKCRLGFCQ